MPQMVTHCFSSSRGVKEDTLLGRLSISSSGGVEESSIMTTLHDNELKLIMNRENNIYWALFTFCSANTSSSTSSL